MNKRFGFRRIWPLALTAALLAALTIGASAWFATQQTVTVARSEAVSYNYTASAVSHDGASTSLSSSTAVLQPGVYTVTIQSAGTAAQACYRLYVGGESYGCTLGPGAAIAFTLGCPTDTPVSVDAVWSLDGTQTLASGSMIGRAPVQEPPQQEETQPAAGTADDVQTPQQPGAGSTGNETQTQTPAPAPTEPAASGSTETSDDGSLNAE